MSLTATTMLVQLSCKAKSFSKLDKEVTAETNIRKKADANASRTHKSLINKSDLNAIQKAMNAAKIYHDHMTLPYIDRGPRLLPSAKYFEYISHMNSLINDVNIAKDQFLEKWDESVENQRQHLAEMWKAEDYPHISQVQQAFGASITFYPLPDSSQLVKLAGLSESEVVQMREEMEASFNAKIAESMKHIWNRVGEAVKKLNTSLRRKDGKLFQSLIDNLKELVRILPDLNITGDKNLESFAKRIENELITYDMTTYKKDDDLKAETAAKAAAIHKAMESYF